MVKFECDICKRAQAHQSDLTTAPVSVKMGNTPIVNLPEVDRCHECHARLYQTIQEALHAIDDTHNTTERRALDANSGIDALWRTERDEHDLSHLIERAI